MSQRMAKYALGANDTFSTQTQFNIRPAIVTAYVIKQSAKQNSNLALLVGLPLLRKTFNLQQMERVAVVAVVVVVVVVVDSFCKKSFQNEVKKYKYNFIFHETREVVKAQVAD